MRPQTVFHLFQTLSSSSEALPTVGSWGGCIGFVIATKYNHTIRRYIQMIVFSVEKNQRWPKTSKNHLPTEIRKSSCIGPDSNKLANLTINGTHTVTSNSNALPVGDEPSTVSENTRSPSKRIEQPTANCLSEACGERLGHRLVRAFRQPRRPRQWGVQDFFHREVKAFDDFLVKSSREYLDRHVHNQNSPLCVFLPFFVCAFIAFRTSTEGLEFWICQ